MYKNGKQDAKTYLRGWACKDLPIPRKAKTVRMGVNAQ
jgi:hypothetical protein